MCDHNTCSDSLSIPFFFTFSLQTIKIVKNVDIEEILRKIKKYARLKSKYFLKHGLITAF